MTAGSFATLAFERALPVAPAVLWQVWTAPAARAIWAAPSPVVAVEFLEADSRVGGREVSLCKVAGEPDIRCELGWLDMVAPGEGALDRAAGRSVNYEVVSRAGVSLSGALVTARIAAEGGGSGLQVTVQLANLAEDMTAGYRAGFAAGLDNLAALARRVMVIERVIAAPPAAVWGAWWSAETLPRWWGPEGFSCRTRRIDLRAGGEWVFDMIGPDGTVWPNHHRYAAVIPEARIDYALHWGEDGPKHADAWVRFEEAGGATRVTLGMAFATEGEWQEAKGFGAEALGLQTLGKLAALLG
ncbi:SRPBCC domain-containing protein [Paragemmobacter ruber]|uniref:ATPase n=1 Tax=Paragemmobacter ruber TaxID=1985673 RepID=A0ABW9Y0T9_9RHOB|nr:SRPBCC domain-containing protein [Rhodobacter ruber]NBE06003.1 ATPase [Rhodobacter ruber]